MIELNEALALLAADLRIDPMELKRYADEDELGGFHADPAVRSFTVGSIWSVEGKVLYALVRALKPKHVLEIGVGYGASSTHILTALKKNRSGDLTSLDINEGAGSEIPLPLKRNWRFVSGDAVAGTSVYEKWDFDFIFEDGPHTYEFTRDVLLNCKRIAPRIILSHDACHYMVGPDVRKGFEEALGSCKLLPIAPSDCGLGYWVRDE